MNKKPSYEELKKEAIELRQMIEALKKREDEYRNSFNLSPDPMAVVQDEVVKLVNSAYTKLFGVTQEEIDNGFSLFEHLQEKDNGGVRQRYKERLSGKELEEAHQVEICNKDGKRVPCEAYSSLIQYNGRPALLAVIRDISKRKQAEKTLRESGTKYEALFEAAGDAIILAKVSNQGFVVADCNPRSLEMFGCTHDELIGRTRLDLSPSIQPDGTPSTERAMEKVQLALEDSPQFFEWQHRRFDGTSFDTENTITKLSLGGEIYIQAIIRDITDRKRTQREIKKHRDHLNQMVIERTKELQKVNKELQAGILKHTQAQKALQDSENKYKALFENAGDALLFMEVGPENRTWCVECNQKTLSLFGCESDDIIGNSPEAFSPETQPDGKPSIEKAARLTKSAMEGQPQDFEWLHHRYDTKEPFWVEINLTQLTLGEKSNYMQAVLHDITERKRADDALKESEETFRLIAETAIEGIYKVNSDGIFVYVNEAYEKMIGYKAGELIGKHYSIVIPEDGRVDAANIVGTVTSGTPLKGEFTMVNELGRKFPGYFSMVRQVEQGDNAGFTGILHDITELKQAENLIRDLHHQLIKSQEDERHTISLELHDRVAQDLSALKISCELLLGYKPLSSGIRNNILEMSANLQKIIKEVRDLSYDLRPAELEELGLTETINHDCKEFSKDHDIHVEFLSTGMDNIHLDFDTKINIYRLVQEALNNIRKHADAGNVKVKCISSFPSIILRIQDDGKGFDTEERLIAAYKEKRMGIRSMKERVGLLQGKMSIESIPGKGTKIFIEIPQNMKTSGHKKNTLIGD